MKSLFLPKYEQKIVKISALTTQGRILKKFCSYFGRNDDFINSFWNCLTFSFPSEYTVQSNFSSPWPIAKANHLDLKTGFPSSACRIRPHQKVVSFTSPAKNNGLQNIFDTNNFCVKQSKARTIRQRNVRAKAKSLTRLHWGIVLSWI